MKLEIVKEMMAQRNFQEYKICEDYMIGKNSDDKFIYIKIYDGKFELNTVREFLGSTFTINSENDNIKIKLTNKEVVQLIIICKSFQNTHLKECSLISKQIQLIKSDFFNINITKKAPLHQKVESSIIKNKREIAIIKETDPNCIFYNFVKGDIIRVVRTDGDICYRMVR